MVKELSKNSISNLIKWGYEILEQTHAYYIKAKDSGALKARGRRKRFWESRDHEYLAWTTECIFELPEVEGIQFKRVAPIDDENLKEMTEWNDFNFALKGKIDFLEKLYNAINKLPAQLGPIENNVTTIHVQNSGTIGDIGEKIYKPVTSIRTHAKESLLSKVIWVIVIPTALGILLFWLEKILS